jgi:hypothetical protein
MVTKYTPPNIKTAEPIKLNLSLPKLIAKIVAKAVVNKTATWWF